MRTLVAAFALATASIAAAPLAAQDSEESSETATLESRAQDVMAWINGEAEPAEIFDQSFLDAIPPQTLAGMNAQMTSQFGSVLGVESVEPTGPHSANVAWRFEKAIGTGVMALTPTEPHKIAGLRLTGFEAVDDSADKIVADIEALAADVEVWFGPLADSAEPVFALGNGERKAIGSTFKLYILSALGREVAAGNMQWSDVVTIDAKSFPSGILQDWPDGSPVTLHTLATLMISRSDNTATDLLIDALGRERVEREVAASGHGDPAIMSPLLTTAEMFVLKAGSAEQMEAFRTGTAPEKLAILDGLNRDGVTLEQVMAAFTGGPNAIDVEWLANSDDLRALLGHIGSADDKTVLDIMAVNTSMPASIADDWAYIGYKGGSEPGVLNYTWLLRDKQGAWHGLIMTWNNPDARLEQPTFDLLAQRIIALAAQ